MTTTDIGTVVARYWPRSGLVDALSRLHGIDGIASVKLAAADIVRHPLVQKIVHAYEEHPKKHH